MCNNIIIKYVITLLLVVQFSANSALASTDGAAAFISGVSDSALTITRNNKFSVEKKEEKLNSLFEQSVDVDWIAKFVMGLYWRDASAQQRQEYTYLYRKFMVSSYVPKFKSYTNQKIEIKNSSFEDQSEYLVETVIRSVDGPSVRVDYKVRKNQDGSYLVFDIIAEGISMITTQRSEFGSILSRKGVDFLIGRLRARVEG